MANVNLKSLIDKLNDPCRSTLESAAGLCMSRTNYNVEVEHWLSRLLDVPDGDFALILRHAGIDASRLTTGLMSSLDRLKTGNARPPALSPDVVQLARESWLVGSVEFGDTCVRSGYILLAMLGDDTLARLLRDVSPEFKKLSADALSAEFPGIVKDSSESQAPAGAQDPGSAPGPKSTQALSQFTVDLTDLARQGRMDPVLGRDAEVRQLVDILTRRRQNNPILTGEPGVGKTAVVEGFAQRIADEDVPESLQNVSVRSLDMALLQAGAGMKGEFENRLKSVIREVQSSSQPIILFIDEAHTIIGAGGQAGQGDAANLLKPALARGELRTIAATTWAEYKKYFERDAALARRFQVVKVEEPEESAAVEMLRGLSHKLESHHGVRILDEALREAVRLPKRYISGRQLPDKAVSVLDTACARVSIGQQATPPAVEDTRRRIEQLGVAIDILQREQAVGAEHAVELASLEEERTELKEELSALEQRWEQEKALVSRINETRGQLEAAAATDATEGSDESDAINADQREDARAQLTESSAKLAEMQGEEPLVHTCVDGSAVAAIVGAWTGIPVGRMLSDEVSAVLELRDRMEESVVGQSHALEAIAESIQISRANLGEPTRPIGVFLLAGTSGVGKTETAITLANLLYGGEQNMTTINMSEFKEEHKVSLLMGSPPGYVGFGEGGVLTEAVRRKPYSVVLLDEMEKAHPGVQDIFYQVFDKGTMKDGEGRDIDFRNTLILMTTNAGTDLIKSLCLDPDTRPDAEGLTESLHEELMKSFKPAFLGRLNVVPYFPLTDDVLEKIVRLKLGKIRRRIEENYGARMECGDDVVRHFVSRCNAVDTGARAIDHLLTHNVLPEMSREFLTRVAQRETISGISLVMEEQNRMAIQCE